MQAYHNSSELRDKTIARAEQHRAADILLSGTYGEMNGEFKGCSVGCDAFDITGEIENYPHKITSNYFGFPLWLEKLRDNIFERLSPEKRNDWHVSYKKAIKYGMSEKEFEMVKAKFLVFVLDLLLEIKGIDKDIVMTIERSKTVWVNYIETGVLDKKAAANAAIAVACADADADAYAATAATAASAVAYAAIVYADADAVYADAAAVYANANAVAANAVAANAAAAIATAVANAATAVAYSDAVYAVYANAAASVATAVANAIATAVAYADAVYADAAVAAVYADTYAYAADDVADVYEKYADHLIILLKG